MLLLILLHDYSCVDWNGTCDHIRDIPWEDIFSVGASVDPPEPFKWLQIGADVYIIYQNT